MTDAGESTESKEMTRKDFLVGDPMNIERVDFEDGKHCFVREMSGGARNDWEESQMTPVKKAGRIVGFDQQVTAFRSKLIVRVLCAEDGRLLFKPDEYETLGGKIGSIRMEKIVAAGMSINKISVSDQKAMEKNLEEGQKEDSSSD